MDPSNSKLYTNEYFQLEDVCRLCWKRNANVDVTTDTMFKKNTSYDLKESLINKITYCLDIVLDVARCPNSICATCNDSIEKFYQFKTICRDKNKKLQTILVESDAHYKTPIINTIKTENFETTPVITKTNESINNFEKSSIITDSGSDCEPLAIYKKKTLKVKCKFKIKKEENFCSLCQIHFDNSKDFNTHNANVHDAMNDLFKCYGCSKQFKNASYRLRHENESCKELKNGYKCSECDQYLQTRKLLVKHRRDHSNNVTVGLVEKSFACKKCSETYTTKEELTKHNMNTHRKNNYVCDSCGRVFKRPDYLCNHKRTHTGEKKHTCSYCGLQFLQRSTLTIHIRKHTGERPYSCPHCSQRCTSSSNLRAHLRLHQGLKKHECTICGRRYGYKRSLDEHAATAHQRAPPHACTRAPCRAVYASSRGLRRHLLAKHGRDDDVLQRAAVG